MGSCVHCIAFHNNLFVILALLWQEATIDWISSILPMSLVVLVVFILDFYVESFCLSKLEGAMTSKVGAMASFISALFFALLWDQPWAWSMHEWHHGNTAGVKHLLSGGTVFSAILFILGKI